jgi:hypothetical protein
MAIKVSKPEINIREKLSDLDFDKVPFQKMPAGSVLQVVTGSLNSAGTTSTSFVNTGLYIDISPKFANSKIMIDVMLGGMYYYQSGMEIRLVNGNAVVGEENAQLYLYGTTTQTTAYVRHQTTYMVTDTPNTTETIRYEMQFKTRGAGSAEICNGASFSTIRATEVVQ